MGGGGPDLLKSASGGAIDEGGAVVDREVLFVLGRDGADFMDEACRGSLGNTGFSITSSDKDKMQSMSEGFYFSDRPLCAL